MDRPDPKTKLSQKKIGREVKRVAKHEDERVVRIPGVPRIAPVGVEPKIVTVVVHGKDVQVAVRVRSVWSAV